MKEPNYVIKTVETIWKRVNTGQKMKVVDKIVIAIVLILVLGSCFFRENLFSEMSIGAIALLIGLLLKVNFFGSKNVMYESEIELRFYDDYFIVYRPKRYYDKRVTRREYNKMYYKDITKCYYKTQMQILYFIGDVDTEWYNYTKEGAIPEKPTRKMLCKGGMQYMSTRLMPDVYAVIKEIEEHSPIRVEILENQ